ncbi:hypothetical protein QBC45DRAFT_111613 [Copromyces sp. CBS 386.78]|nr:hypothetical protein QBC45DRAFT_111613 [Copromyces sp. CBS 386.78]
MARCKNQQAQNGHQLSSASSTVTTAASSGIAVSGPAFQAPESGQVPSAAPTTTTMTTAATTSSPAAASTAATTFSAAALAQLNERGCEALLGFVDSKDPLVPLSWP